RATLSDARERRAAVRRADRAVEAHGRHAELLHLEVLVLEERQQRRDHHRRARQEERGELVAEGLAAARGQDQEDVLAREHGGDGALLLTMKPSDAEALPRQLPDQVRAGALWRLLVSGFRCHLPPSRGRRR